MLAKDPDRLSALRMLKSRWAIRGNRKKRPRRLGAGFCGRSSRERSKRARFQFEQFEKGGRPELGRGKEKKRYGTGTISSQALPPEEFGSNWSEPRFRELGREHEKGNGTMIKAVPSESRQDGLMGKVSAQIVSKLVALTKPVCKNPPSTVSSRAKPLLRHKQALARVIQASREFVSAQEPLSVQPLSGLE